MKSEQRSQAFLRKQKMMLVMPLLVIPFLTMAFWALGGGQGKQSDTVAKQTGLNLNLPDSKPKDDNLIDKLSFYDKADRDSAKMEEWMRTDPYYQQKRDSGFLSTDELQMITQNTATKYNQHLNTSPYQANGNNPEEKLMQKIELLQKEMNKQPDESTNSSIDKFQTSRDDGFSGEVDKLQNMMQLMNTNGDEDPEMAKLNGTLEKILDIQHPERVKDKLKEKSLQQKEIVFTVSRQPTENNIGILDTTKRKNFGSIGFYSTENNSKITEDENAIEAVITENQVLVNGAVIKLRLLTDIFINGVLIAKNNLVSGIASLNDERLQAEITTIRFNNSLFSVKLEVYDLDGLPGIYIPGAITRDVAKQSADNGLQLMELTAVDPTLKAQAAAAGINTVKTLLSKKIKQVKVMVKAGYKVLLRDKNVQQ